MDSQENFYGIVNLFNTIPAELARFGGWVMKALPVAEVQPKTLNVFVDWLKKILNLQQINKKIDDLKQQFCDEEKEALDSAREIKESFSSELDNKIKITSQKILEKLEEQQKEIENLKIELKTKTCVSAEWVKKFTQACADRYSCSIDEKTHEVFLKDNWPNNYLELRPAIENWFKIGSMAKKLIAMAKKQEIIISNQKAREFVKIALDQCEIDRVVNLALHELELDHASEKVSAAVEKPRPKTTPKKKEEKELAKT